MSANAEFLFEGVPAFKRRTPATVDPVTSADELAAVRRLRYSVLVREMGCYASLADHASGELADAADAQALHWSWTERGRLSGAVRQLQGRSQLLAAGLGGPDLNAFAAFPDSAFTLSDFRVLVPASRNGRGHINLLQASYRAAREAGARFDFVEVRPRQIRAWEQLGYRRYTRVHGRPGLGALQPMVLVMGDRGYLERLHSPLLPSARMFPAEAADGAWFEATFPESPSLAPNPTAARLARQRAEQMVRGLDIPLFAALDATARVLLLTAGTRVVLPAGLSLDAPAECARGLCLVLGGGLKTRGSERVFGPGSVVGSLAFSSQGPQPGGPVAVTDSELLLLDPLSLQRLGHQLPGLTSRLSAALDNVHC